MTTRNPNRCPTHPGEVLAEIIPETGKTKSEIAQMLGISRQHLYDILNAKKTVSPAISACLGKMFGDGAAIWLRMQPIMMRGMLNAKQMLAKFQHFTLFDFVTQSLETMFSEILDK